ncbi:MAG: right-handed parallel beta-helix repeat-containing protein [Geminicoccaceae bacterium]|nr:right-handed parallel beta-helix repeat-containing protein [Geminicoccaceae bacterium]MDW8125610.1 right-handed parallel beta-helix repeat-containing protein [Geminicoccaceae bacterium]MDW8342315.1 right-handed parallel beta-helix repeat-containing protein [Geminicoccaceae bacterium]
MAAGGRRIALAIALAAGSIPVGTAVAELRIELRDGRVFVLPFERHEVRRIWFDGEEVEDAETAVRLEEDERPDAPEADPIAAALAEREGERARGRVLRVGPGEAFRVPSEAAARARAGDTVEILPGHYSDVAIWRADRLTIRGVGGTPVIDGGGRGAGGKAVWVVAGREVVIENVELTGARVPDRNGAGIRAEGADLTLRAVRIHGNEIGILSAVDFSGELRIERSEFFANFVPDWEAAGVPPGHNVYVGGADRFTLLGSWIRGAVDGHNVKTRAKENRILYNRIEDVPNGASSYLVDIAVGAPTLLLGNLLIEGAGSPNRAVVAVAAEGGRERGPFVFAFNTVLAPLPENVAVFNHGTRPVRLLADLVVGPGILARGPFENLGTRSAPLSALLDPARDDFRPRPGSPAIDVAPSRLGRFRGLSLEPAWSYRHPAGLERRTKRGRAHDAGAFEAGG